MTRDCSWQGRQQIQCCPLLRVSRPVAKLLGQLVHNILIIRYSMSYVYIRWFKVHDELSDLVSSWVNVLSKEIEEQPITNITSSNNCVNTFSFDPPTTEQQQMCEISEFRGWGLLLLRNSVSGRRKGSRYCEAQGKGRAKGRLRKAINTGKCWALWCVAEFLKM